MLWVNTETMQEVDIDTAYKIGWVKALTMYEDKFYVLANKYNKKLGYYLIELNTGRPGPENQPRFLIKWLNKLEIADAALIRWT